MLDVQRLELAPSFFETAWIGDSSFDAGATEMERWLFTGEGFALHPKTEASVIRYRGLTPRELRNVLAKTAGYIANQPAELVRYGLKNVKGVKLRFGDHGGVRGLADDSIDLLNALTHELPAARLYNHFLEVAGVNPEIRLPEGDALEPVSLVDWLGGVIAGRTFRR